MLPKLPLPTGNSYVTRTWARLAERARNFEAWSSVLLFGATALALYFANSSYASTYRAVLDAPIGVNVGPYSFQRPLAWFVDDGLMTIFFFVVGLEIRREISFGELRDLRRATLPFAAAIGGMLVPAMFYLSVASAPETRSGWGVPMATDIAFAVGLVTVLGKRVPAPLRVLLLALAVIDDLGAIIVIALFYSSGVSATGFAVAAVGIAVTLMLQRADVRDKVAYLLPGLCVWGGVYAAGVHPTIAGVLLGLITPVFASLGRDGFVDDTREALGELESISGHASSQEVLATLRRVDAARRDAMSPAESLYEMLHPLVTFLIMPIFAIVNAGVRVDFSSLDQSALHIVGGVTLGLVVGKPVGVLLATTFVLRTGLASLPAGLGTRHLVLLGTVAGVGFTMSLFVSQLAFKDPAMLSAAKLGVLGASVLASLLTLIVGAFMRPQEGELASAEAAAPEPS